MALINHGKTIQQRNINVDYSDPLKKESYQ